MYYNIAMVENSKDRIDDLSNLLKKKGYLDEEVQDKMVALKDTFRTQGYRDASIDRKNLINIPMNPILKETVDL